MSPIRGRSPYRNRNKSRSPYRGRSPYRNRNKRRSPYRGRSSRRNRSKSRSMPSIRSRPMSKIFSRPMSPIRNRYNSSRRQSPIHNRSPVRKFQNHRVNSPVRKVQNHRVNSPVRKVRNHRVNSPVREFQNHRVKSPVREVQNQQFFPQVREVQTYDRQELPPKRLREAYLLPFVQKRPPPNANFNLTDEERDKRSIVVLRMKRDTTPEDLFTLFSIFGHIRDIQILVDQFTRRSKGVAFVEFWEKEAVMPAIAMNGLDKFGTKLEVKPKSLDDLSEIEFVCEIKRMKLRVSNVHSSVNEETLWMTFGKFGPLEGCYFKNSTGYVVFRNADDGKKAIEQAGRMRIAGQVVHLSIVENGEELPAVNQEEIIPEEETQCFVLNNMFNPLAEKEIYWELAIRAEVIKRCDNDGVFISIDGQYGVGYVYVKCSTTLIARHAVARFREQYYEGRMVAASYIPLKNFHVLFPEALY